MKKNLFFLSLVCFSFAKSQLYVSNQSYMMVSDAYVYSTGALQNAGDPTNGSNIYLRRDGQLLQNAANNVNSGSGNLSVYQEGTSSDWQHNAWCSPVGQPSGTGNTDFGIGLLRRPTSISGFATPTIITGFNGSTSDTHLAISQRWIYTYVNSNSYAGWNYIANATSIAPGLGFSMKGTSGTDTTTPFTGSGQNKTISGGMHAQRYEFRGKPNSGNITAPISPGNRTLIGNPYPSAIDLNLFLGDSDNTPHINGAAYFWEQADTGSHNLNAYQGGYGVYTPGTGYTQPVYWTYNSNGTPNTNIGFGGTAGVERRFSPIGQGFMIQGQGTAGNVTIKNTHRLYRKEGASHNSEFRNINSDVKEVNSSTRNNYQNEYYEHIPNLAGIDYTQIRKGHAPQIKISTKVNDSGVIPSTLAFDREATDGFDYGFDAHNVNAVVNGMYFNLVDFPNDEFIVSTVAFDLEKRVPFTLKCNATSNFKINVTELKYGFSESNDIYVYDANSNTYHDIKNNTFNIDLKPGVYNRRFFITFTNRQNPNIGIMPSLSGRLMLIQDNNEAKLSIINKDQLNIKEFYMYDTAGRLLINKKDLGTDIEYSFNTNNYPEGVYLTKTILVDNTIKNEKIIIDNK